ncbi:MAG: glycoside hydrolase family 2 TIM barrel-domain containing protein [Candidatus Omnitrophica bacterium]|nr:glycoside hydrolase family 2 TIM barrel-domain containing protein [Candidatus Omnitrophota bacterium]
MINKKFKLKPKKQNSNKKFILFVLALFFMLLLGICVALIVKFSSKPGVAIQKNSKGDYVLTVNNKPYIVRGVCYNPTPVGEGPIYNWWGNPAKPWIADGSLMKEAGINTVRFYEPGGKPEQVKSVISDFYEKYGIRSVMGHGLGFWDYPHANYADIDFRQKIKKQVYQMVQAYKREPGVMAWVLGNEANYSFDGSMNSWSTPELDAIENAKDRQLAKAKIYYTFLNDLARIVKTIDPTRPVGFGNGELGSIEIAKEYCPDFDFAGIIIYRGKSFGNLFRQLKERYGKPCMIIEFGCDSYNALKQEPDEESQAFFLKTLWQEVDYNTYRGKGEGNCLGGLIFSWTDEWWKSNQDDPKTWSIHNTEASWTNASYYFDTEGNPNMNEEWFGIVSVSSEKENGIDKRLPKRSYGVLKELWLLEDKPGRN